MHTKLAFYTPPFPRVKSYYDLIDTAAEHGLPYVEGFTLFELAAPDVAAAQRLRDYADSRGVRFCCMSVFADLASESTDTLLPRLQGYARVAAALGSPFLHHTIVGTCSSTQKVLPRAEELYRQGLALVRQVYDYAAPLGVKTVYENQGFVFNGVGNFGRFLREIDRPVGVVADFGNIAQADEDILGFIDAFADKIVHVHLKDVLYTPERQSERSLPTRGGAWMTEVQPGTGHVDFAGAIARLQAAGYTGCYALEYAAPTDDSPAMAQTLELLDSCLKK